MNPVISNRSLALWFLAALAAFTALYAFLLPAVAHADPVAVAQASADGGWAMVSTYGPIWGGGLLLFALGGSFLRWNESTHWIAQGRTLAILTGLLSVLGAIAQWHFNGGSSAGIITTLVAAVSLVLHPVTTAPSSTATSSRGTSSSVALLAVLLLGGLAVTQLSCAKAKLTATTVATTAGHELVNCTGQAIGTTPALDLATLVAVANTVSAERSKCTPPGGSLSWPCVEADLIAEGKVLGGCTFVKLIASELAPGTTARMATGDRGRAALEDFRARVAGGAIYHTGGGDI